MTFIPHVIDGQESESASGARFASVDPWTREPYAEVALGGEQDADRAVRAARRALAWGNTVVLKPAEDTPASATIMARLALEAA
jgi:acyl-CoA reductase-like NAD-dependent aldehyde dehydrogenase